MEWNGMEKANKHGTELLSQLGLHPRAYGPQNYTPANCSCCKDQPETKPIIMSTRTKYLQNLFSSGIMHGLG